MAGLQGNILITGGAGFLGRGILRRAEQENWSARFTVLSRDEKKQHECADRFPNVRYVLGDVTDLNRLRLVLIGHDAIIHAAALKYIPEGEFNADECVRINIDGARCVIDAARSSGIARVVGISTDKAAQPVNIYGMTKAVMERLFSEAGFNTCRYGNVVGSTGSVVPVMQQQYQREGHVKITDPAMTRFWMSIDDAVSTIIRAFDAEPGSVTIPDPRASSMHEMAYGVLASLGDTSRWEGAPGEDPRVQVIGKRPGEKQHEDLVTHYEMYRTRPVEGGYEIMPPGYEDYSRDRVGLSSSDARFLWRDELARMIKDAVTV